MVWFSANLSENNLNIHVRGHAIRKISRTHESRSLCKARTAHRMFYVEQRALCVQKIVRADLYDNLLSGHCGTNALY
jgi:hypothetical protein